MVTCLDELLTERAAAAPASALVEYEDRSLSYGQVGQLVDRGARWLVASGIQPGDRVLVLGDNSDGFVIAVMAVLRAGAIFVPISTRVARTILPFIVAKSGARAVFADTSMMAECAENLSGMVRREFAELLADSAHVETVRIGQRADVAAIIFTSGSSGIAQGVVCTHSAILAVIRAINTVLGQRSDDRILCVLPFSFDYGLYQLFLAMDCGAAIVVASTATGAANIPRLLVTRSITVLPIVPALSVMLLRSRALERLPRLKLRLVTSTGDLFPISQQERLRGLLVDTVIVPMYGLTECKRVTIVPPSRGNDARPGSVGLPLPGTDVILRPLDGIGGKVDEWGELLVRGPHLMAGYWEDLPATRARFLIDSETGERTLRSGDVFFNRDRKGFLTFLGRAGAIGQCHGKWLFPALIEDQLAGLPGVDQAAVVITRQGGEAIGIAAYLSTLVDNPSLETTARAMIADNCGYFAKIEVRCLQKLPYTSNGKIDRIALARVNAPHGVI